MLLHVDQWSHSDINMTKTEFNNTLTNSITTTTTATTTQHYFAYTSTTNNNNSNLYNIFDIEQLMIK